MEVVYRFGDDKKTLQAMQEASLHHEWMGLRTTHGLVGSKKWWSNIRSGKLKVYTVRGVVRGLWFDQYHSGPATFQMELPDGTFFGGQCHLEPVDADKAFALGRIVEVDYVLQFAKVPREGRSDPQPHWLELRLGGMAPGKVVAIRSSEKNFGRFAAQGGGIAESGGASRPWWAFWRDA